MKSLKWVITVILILCIIGLVVFYAWSWLHVNDQLKTFLNRQLAAALGEQAHLETVNLRWGTAYVMGLDLPLSSAVHLSIDSARVVINPVRYVTSGFQIRELISSVYAHHPAILWNPFITKKESKDSSHVTSPLKLATICQFAEPWSDGFLFTWDDGTLLVVRGNDTLDVLPEFRGMIRGRGKVIAIDAIGGCFADSDNMSISSKLNIDSVSLTADLKVHQASLSEIFVVSRNLSGGREPSNLTLSASLSWDSTKIALQGEGSVDSLSVPVDTLFVALIPTLRFDISNSNLQLRDGTVQLPGVAIEYSGSIGSIFSPVMNLKLQIPETPVNIITSLIPKFPVPEINGKVNGTVQISGPLDNIHFATSLFLPSLSWREWNTRDVTIACTGHPKLFTVDFSADNLLESRIHGTSEIDLRNPSPTLTSKITAAGGFLRHWLPDAPELVLTGSGTWSNHATNWKGQLIRGDQPPAKWKFGYQNSTIQVYISRPNGYDISAELAGFSLTNHFHADVKCINLFAHELLNRRLLPPDWDVSATVSGNLQHLDYNAEVIRDSHPWQLQTQGTYDRQSPSGAIIAGKLALTGISFLPPMSGSYQVVWDADSLTVKNLTVDDYLTADAVINLSPVALKNFDLSINRLNLDDLSRQVPFLSARGVSGIINAEFLGRESQGTLHWDGNIHWFDGAVAGIQELWGTGTLQGTSSRITIKECHLGQGIQLPSYADGIVDIADDTLSLSTFSQTKTVQTILSALIGKKVGWISGGADLDVTANGSLAHPKVRAYLGLSQGNLSGIPYDKVEIYSEDLFQNLENGDLTIDSLKGDIGKDFHFRGNGMIPVKSSGAFDCTFRGSGDLLAVLHQLTSFFKEASGGTKFHGHLGGTLHHPHLDSTEIGIRDGRLVMNGLFGETDNINCDILIQPDGFVSIKQWEFQTHGVTMTLRNYPELRIETGFLEPISLGIFGLNLGICVLDPSPGAIQLNLPGLMEPGWYGNLELSGRVEGEKFLIAGPSDHLLIRGSATISNATLTYPFIGGTGRPSSFVQAVIQTLENAHWDLNLNVGSDVHYSRIITTTENVPIIGPISTVFNRITTDITADPKMNALTVQHPDTTYIMEGTIESTEGKVEFLDLNFDVDRVTLEFDRFDPRPWVSARARTTVTDSLGIMRTIYLTFYSVDSLTGTRSLRGRWGDFTLVLEDDQNHSQEQILSTLGYSIANLTEKASVLGETVVGVYLNQIVIRPVEQAIRRVTSMDRVEINPRFVQNVLRTDVLGSRQTDTSRVNFGVKYLTGSQISVGKYLTHDLFLGYTGELAGQMEGIAGGRLGLIHLWSMEYRMKPLSPYLVLDLTYEYDDLDRRSDRAVLLRYSFGLP
jgi:hypothetical protein